MLNAAVPVYCTAIKGAFFGRGARSTPTAKIRERKTMRISTSRPRSTNAAFGLNPRARHLSARLLLLARNGMPRRDTDKVTRFSHTAKLDPQTGAVSACLLAPSFSWTLSLLFCWIDWESGSHMISSFTALSSFSDWYLFSIWWKVDFIL